MREPGDESATTTVGKESSLDAVLQLPLLVCVLAIGRDANCAEIVSRAPISQIGLGGLVLVLAMYVAIMRLVQQSPGLSPGAVLALSHKRGAILASGDGGRYSAVADESEVGTVASMTATEHEGEDDVHGRVLAFGRRTREGQAGKAGGREGGRREGARREGAKVRGKEQKRGGGTMDGGRRWRGGRGRGGRGLQDETEMKGSGVGSEEGGGESSAEEREGAESREGEAGE